MHGKKVGIVLGLVLVFFVTILLISFIVLKSSLKPRITSAIIELQQTFPELNFSVEEDGISIENDDAKIIINTDADEIDEINNIKNIKIIDVKELPREKRIIRKVSRTVATADTANAADSAATSTTTTTIFQSLEFEITTPIIALENLNKPAKILLKKYGEINTIFYCRDFDFNADDSADNFDVNACKQWEETDIKFETNSTHVWFNVSHFSAYAGGYVNRTFGYPWNGTFVNTTVNAYGYIVLNSSAGVYYYNGTFTSIAINANTTVHWDKIFFDANIPASTEIKFQLAYSNDCSTFSSFLGPDGTNNSYYNETGQLINISNSQCLMWRTYLSTTDNTTTPELINVTIKYNFIDINANYSDTTRLEIWDNSEIDYVLNELIFYANYTNFTSGKSINDTIGSCSVRHNMTLTGVYTDWLQMNYNSSIGLWVYNVSPVRNYGGFYVNCSSPYFDTLTLFDTIEVGFFCDSGNLSETCYVNHDNKLKSPVPVLNGKNLVVESLGKIYVGDNSSITINLTGNLTIMQGGEIYTPEGDYDSGNITIFADVVNISGSIWSAGRYRTCACDVYFCGYRSGKIKINASEFYLYGSLRSYGKNVVGGICNHAGNGNLINITANRVMFQNSTLDTHGGNSGGDDRQDGGHGGNIVINANILNISNNHIYIYGGKGTFTTYPGHGGDSGNITLNAENINIKNTLLNAKGGDARHKGWGGNINLTANIITIDNQSSMDVSSPDPSRNGSISITRLCGYDRANTIGASPIYSILSGYAELDEDAVYHSSTVCPLYFDNCPFVKNPDQYDYDNDGEGDACDTYLEFLLESQQDNYVDINLSQINLTVFYKTGRGNLVPPIDISFFTITFNNNQTKNCKINNENPCVFLIPQPGFGNYEFYAEANGTGETYNYANLTDTIKVRDTLVSLWLESVYFFGGYKIGQGRPFIAKGYVNLTNGSSTSPLQDLTVYFYRDGVFNTTAITSSEGYYEKSFQDSQLGMHSLKANATWLGVYGESIVYYEVFLPTAIVNTTYNNQTDLYVDIDDEQLNVSAIYIRSDTNQSIPGNWNITLNNITKNCYGVSQCEINYSLGSNKEINIPKVYIIKYEVENLSGYFSGVTKEEWLKITNITINASIATHFSPGQESLLYGKAYYIHELPYPPLVNMNISIYHDGIFENYTRTNTSGEFNYSFKAKDEAGFHTILLNVTDQYKVSGIASLTYGIYYLTNTSIVNWTYDKTIGLFNITANYTNASNNALLSGNFAIKIKSNVPASNNVSEKYCNATQLCNVNFTMGQNAEVRGNNVVITVTAENESAFYNASTTSLSLYLEEPTTTASLIAEDKTIYDKTVSPYLVNISVNLTNTGHGTMYNPIIYIDGIDNPRYNAITQQQNCNNLTPGQKCQKNFTINISAEVGYQDNANILWKTNWTDNDGSQRQISNYSIINISGYAHIETNQTEYTFDINHNETKTFYIVVNSTGNADVLGLNISFNADTINESWVDFVWESNNEKFIDGICSPLNYQCREKTYDRIKITVSIPAFTDPSIYNGTLYITTSNANNLTLKININVTKDGKWEWKPPSYVEAGYGPGIKELFTIPIKNKGNIPLNFTINYADNLSTQLFFQVANNPTHTYINKGSEYNLTINYSSISPIEGPYRLNLTMSYIDAVPSENTTSIIVKILNFPPQITDVRLTNISNNHYVNIPINITASIFNDDGIHRIDKVWLELRLPNGTIQLLENLGTKTNALFSLVPEAIGNYSFTIFANDTSGNLGNYTSNFTVIYDTFPPIVHWINVNTIEIGNPTTIELNVTDDLMLDKVLLEIKDYWNNNTVYSGFMQKMNGLYVYSNTFAEGDYIAYTTINDTSNNKAYASAFFKVYRNISLDGSLNDKNQSANFSFCLPNSTICYQNLTINATYTIILYSGKADIIVNIDNEIFITFYNVDISTLTNNFIRVKKLPTTITVGENLITHEGIAIDAYFVYDKVDIKFTYDPNNVLVPSNLKIFKCINFIFNAETCIDIWQEIPTSVIGTNVLTNLTNLSGFLLVEDRSGVLGGQTVIGRGGRGVGGIGLSTLQSELERLKMELITALGRVENLQLDVGEITKELYPGEITQTKIRITNTANISQLFDVSSYGDITDLIEVSPTRLAIPAKSVAELIINIAVPNEKKPGLYVGSLLIGGATTLRVPVTIRVLEPKEKLLDLRVIALYTKARPGEKTRIGIDLFNLGIGRFDVRLFVEIVNAKTLEVISKHEETFAIETSISKIIEMYIPENVPLGNYIVRATASYEYKNVMQKATALTYIRVAKPWYSYTLFGIPIWILVVGISFILLNLISFEIYEKRKERKKRYRVPVEYSLLPQPTERSVWVGHLAETKVRTFLDLDKLQMHTIIAGATGGGKTIAAQIIIEEALKRNIAVIVFDPSAQWTGFLRKCKEKYMLKYYKEFGLSQHDVKAFNGNIHQVVDPKQILNIRKYIVSGEIHIFTLNKLKPKDMDLFVASSIKQIFDMTPKESPELKTLIVYDEVHRLLPKFGGSGEGFLQIERACREFRKWGIGLVLISQLASDFIGAIKANIMTEIQVRTRDEGDLERIKLKYGDAMMQAVVKAAIGTGMLVNPEYNRGRPYFVSFRPVLHSVTRLSDEELENYNKYNARIEQLEYEIEQLEKYGIDVFDLKLELKLALDKVKVGNFSMADIYLESLEPRVKKEFEKIGKKPKLKEIKYVALEEIKKEVMKAKKEREKYIEEEKKRKLEEIKHDYYVEAEKKLEKVKGIISELNKKGVYTKIEEMKIASIPADIKLARIHKDVRAAKKIITKLEEIEKHLKVKSAKGKK